MTSLCLKFNNLLYLLVKDFWILFILFLCNNYTTDINKNFHVNGAIHISTGNICTALVIFYIVSLNSVKAHSLTIPLVEVHVISIYKQNMVWTQFITSIIKTQWILTCYNNSKTDCSIHFSYRKKKFITNIPKLLHILNINIHMITYL